MDLKCHVYNIPGISNIRDLGGYAAKNGKKIKKGRFIRSTALAGIDEEGINALIGLNIDCVIDLRSVMERNNAPDVIEDHGSIHFAHVPLLDYIQSNFVTGDFSGLPSSMEEMYALLLDKAGDSFKTIFELFADKRFSHYLFHCTAGKDRTGITAMLLLGLAGVDDEMIIEDYSYTRYLLGPTPLNEYPADIPAYLFESAPKTMRAAIDHINTKYGGVNEYLLRAGLSGEKLQIITNKLLD